MKYDASQRIRMRKSKFIPKSREGADLYRLCTEMREDP